MLLLITDGLQTNNSYFAFQAFKQVVFFSQVFYKLILSVYIFIFQLIVMSHKTVNTYLIATSYWKCDIELCFAFCNSYGANAWSYRWKIDKPCWSKYRQHNKELVKDGVKKTIFKPWKSTSWLISLVNRCWLPTDYQRKHKNL